MTDSRKVDRELMKKSNMKLVFSTLWSAGEASKAQLAEATGMSFVSMSRITDELIERGLIKERERADEKQATMGRPPKVLSLAAERLLCCGAYLHQGGLRLGLVDPFGTLLEQECHSFPEGEGFLPERVLPWMADCIADYLKKHEALEIFHSVGVVAPGIVYQKGQLQFSANFRWRNVPISEFLKDRMPDYDFYLENDIKAMALAEHRFGAAADSRNMVVLSLGDGIGSAAILDSKIYRGHDNVAGEIGHIILNPAGKICECGQVGCLQTNLSQRAILNEARSVFPDITMPELFAYYQKGDPFAVALIGQMVDYISIAINLLANAYAPEVVLLCGSTLWENPILRSLVGNSYRSRLNEYMQNAFELRFDTFGVDGHVVGAGAMAFEQVIDALF